MILAVDFDGVIHNNREPVPGRRMGGPVEGARESINRLMADGHTVIVHSQWGGGDGQKIIADWMRFYGIPYHEITNIKPKADVYLDDKAARFTSWGDFRPEQYAEGAK